ncbi:glycosyltransferase family A protein [Paenibacillus sp. CF384]|uniref:glycosyltransferase family 2 protein n=1 Tax=Paenibacillus sp. CF384 TaxID=1884382 RepID=UPI00089943DA|nr:glycosyltransferase family A protein [Paenibacillus sp. CF384]SDX72175.1 Glycosyltransferase involved in cell wall bisynthesis [Paenibacillus sp. CF384]
MLPLVSVVIPFYDCPYVDQALNSVMNQTYANIEILVVDDGSTQFLDKVEPYMEKIKYIRKVNGGTATALNTGIVNASGDFFVWLSADDVFHPDKITKQIIVMLDNSGHFCHTSYSQINDKNQIIGTLKGFDFPKRIHLVNTLILGCIINGSSVMIDMGVFQSIGLFDESLRFTHDYDMWLRMLPHYEFYYLHEDLVQYRIHKNMGSTKYADEIQNEIIFVQEKHRAKTSQLVRFLQQETT